MERLVPFGKYFLLERINVGGMAEVFKAKTVGVEGFEKVVAIKRILPAVAEDEDFIKMFVDEAKITSQLSHANLAQTFDLGKIDEAYYIAMEYVPGKDLRSVFERLKRRGERVPFHVAAYVMARVCDGLDYAHRKRDAAGKHLGIVHRDVSPQNIIVSFEGEVKLVDFGIAKAANKITKTQAGILKGKFGYMSPEQVRGLSLDGRSDIFAAGVVLYELVTGERLFTGSSDFSVLEKVQAARITPPSQLQHDVPAHLERVILKALARETEDRYQHAADLGADLTRFLLEHRGKSVTREDVAAFMKATFPQDQKDQQQLSLDQARPPRVEAQPPVVEEKWPEPTPPPQRVELPPEPPKKAAPLVDDTVPTAQKPEPKRAEPQKMEAEDEGEGPTRPMSMDDLAAAERAYAQRLREAEQSIKGERAPPPLPHSEQKTRHSRPPPPLPSSLLADGPPLAGAPEKAKEPPRDPALPDPSFDVTDPGIETAVPKADATQPHAFVPPAPPPPAPPMRARAEEPPLEPRNPSLQIKPPVSLSRPPPPVPNGSLRGEPPAARSEGRVRSPSGPVRRPQPPPQQKPAPAAAEPPPPPPPPKPRPERQPFGGRIAPVKAAPEPADVLRHQLLVRRALYAVITLALAVTAWALFSAARQSRTPSQSGVPTGSITVTVEPEDAVVQLDGAQVKAPLDPDWNEPRLSARVEHKIAIRREGFEEQTLPVNLQPGENKRLEVKLQPLPGQLTIRSMPAGAQVFLDGTRRGQTPLYLADVDQSEAHAIVMEKHCFNTWQLAVPAHAGKREVVATLQPAPGACVGRVAHEEAPAPEVPDDPQALASLGYLSLGTRPASANVFIDGVDIGRTTPLQGWPLKVGKHKVRLRAGKKVRDVSVEILSGQTHSEIVDLRKR